MCVFTSKRLLLHPNLLDNHKFYTIQGHLDFLAPNFHSDKDGLLRTQSCSVTPGSDTLIGYFIFDQAHAHKSMFPFKLLLNNAVYNKN